MEHNPFLGFHLPKDLNSKYFQSVHKCLIAFNNSKKGMLIVQALVLFEAVNAVSQYPKSGFDFTSPI
jgi:hypothetical protein